MRIWLIYMREWTALQPAGAGGQLAIQHARARIIFTPARLNIDPRAYARPLPRAHVESPAFLGLRAPIGHACTGTDTVQHTPLARGCVRSCLSDIACAPINNPAWLHATLPDSIGGLGLTSAMSTRSAAY